MVSSVMVPSHIGPYSHASYSWRKCKRIVSVQVSYMCTYKDPTFGAIFGARENGKDDDAEIERRLLWSSSGQKKLLSDLCTWRIGGPCRYFLEVRHPWQLAAAVRCCQKWSVPFLIVGKGSNCLFDSRGYDGCILLNQIEMIERGVNGIYIVGSGYPYNRLGVQCSQEGYSGLEFAHGVPGTTGGAVFMNAGANGQETAGVIDSVQILTVEGDLRTLKRCDLKFGYRKSIFQEMEDLAAILAVKFQLIASVDAERRQKDFWIRRQKTQPLGEWTAGSVFLNPSGANVGAGELIEKAGLKGFKLGGAKVSEVHANFFVNFNRATSGDMLSLISYVKEKVEKKFHILLQEEIRIIPYQI